MRGARTPDELVVTRSEAVLETARSQRRQPTGRLAVSTTLDPGNRDVQAHAVLESLVEQWALPPDRSRRWIAAAGAALHEAGPVEMFVQYDQVTRLLTLELWAQGQVVFAVHDWLEA